MQGSADEAAAAGVLDIMDTGRIPEGLAPTPAETAYRSLFAARFDDALNVVRSAPRSPYLIAVHRQVEALCTGAVPTGADGSPDLDVSRADPATLAGAMAVFHTSEAAHVVGDLDACIHMLETALEAGVPHVRARFWLRLSCARALLFRGDWTRADEVLTLAESEATTPLAIESGRCVRAMVAGLAGDRPQVVRVAERITQRVQAPATYAEAGIALLGAYGLAGCGLAQQASDLLRLGSGGPGLPLLPRALRAYGYDMLVEAAIGAGDPELASWMLLDLDRLDLGANHQLLSARETAHARVRIALGDVDGGTAQARRATEVAFATGSALVGVRAAAAAMTTSDTVDELLSSVTSDDVRAWLERSLAARGRRVGSAAAWLSLTPAQQTVARLAARGLRNHEIARLLVVSTRTVETHVAAVLDTLGVSNRVGIVTSAASGRTAQPAVLARLSPRQRDVATELVAGRTNGQIAERLSIGTKAVEQHVRGILRTLDVDSRAAAVARLVGEPGTATGGTHATVAPAPRG